MADDVGSVRGETSWTMGFARDGWQVQTVSRTALSSTADEFQLHAQLDAYENAQRVFERTWRLRIPRDHV